MPNVGLKYTVQYSALVETQANVCLALLVKLCTSRKYPYPSGTEGNGNSEGRGWGFKKGAISEGVRGGLSSLFSEGSE